MSNDLIATKVQTHNFGTGDEKAYVAIHTGKNVEKTMDLVGLVYHFKNNFYSGPVTDIADTLDEDIDTNCFILPDRNYSPLKPGIRIFDLACAYASEELVRAMMKHPDTPVGKLHGVLERHSSLTFLANTIAGWHEIKSHENFDKYVTSRRGMFKTLIEDPRTPVNHRVNTYDGGKTLDVLDILKRYEDANSLAYYPIVSRLLWQRQAAIATQWDFKDEMHAAFTAASSELVKDDDLCHMDKNEKQTFLNDLQGDINNQYARAFLLSRGKAESLGPTPITFLGLDVRDIVRDNMKAISVDEAIKARKSIAQQIWLDCADLACQKNRIGTPFGKSDLYKYVKFIDEALQPKPQDPALTPVSPRSLPAPGPASGVS